MKSQLAVNDARRRLLDAVRSRQLSESESVGLNEAAGRVLAEDVRAQINVPPAANSAMDGYALRFAEGQKGAVLPVSQTVAAGSAPQPLQPGSAARILTGAEIPPGADSVIIQENVKRVRSEQGEHITLNTEAELGANIRPQGQDIAKGNLVLARGSLLTPAHIGLLASVGVVEACVYKPLKVALISTGDELVEPGCELGVGQIYNSNQPMLAALVREMGARVVLQQRVVDNYDRTVSALREAAELADIIISCGGVSVGDEDHVKAALQTLGELSLWKVAMKPGKPLAFGRVEDKPFVGLPGNPVSAWVTFQLMVRPALKAMMGGQETELMAVSCAACFERAKPGTRDEYARGRLVDGGVELYGQQSSGVLSSVAWADCLVLLPAGEAIKKGQSVQVYPFAQW
ncbi:gephyrin-like molybdotransferase Glp [Gilvimarinus chinensis]|uniref:molybdopterin molybdotransferase MoeA n=1 Tax=Gilvimarinus chinensis TaxID=396005 RepID=UPI00036BDFD3|nr:gephyrin-like molybdotransferase Glp [Gilvimarinus chinensis]